MARYRQKPIIFQAFRLGYDSEPEWFKDDERIHDVITGYDGTSIFVSIDTVEGTALAMYGDYVIRGFMDELCICKSEIFEALYETIDEKEIESGRACKNCVFLNI